MTKQDDTKRGEILLQNLIHGNKFQRGLKAARIIFSIPINGYKTAKDVYGWYDEFYHTKKKGRAFKRKIDEFLKEQELPAGTWWHQRAIELALTDGRFNFLPRTHGAGPFVELKSTGVSRKGSYIDIRLYEGVGHRDVRSAIGRIGTPSHRKGTRKLIRSERRDQKDINEALRVYNLPREERKQKAGTNKWMMTTKETETSGILKGMGINMSGDAVKALKHRRKNKKR